MTSVSQMIFIFHDLKRDIDIIEIDIIMADERDMPDELLVEILARLPVKSLIKFTCVCKSWLSLIKSPEFAAKQYATRTLSLSRQNPHDCHFLMAVSTPRCDPVGEIALLSYETLDISARYECKPSANSSIIDSDHEYPWCFYGPCNGIFCIAMHKCEAGDFLFLWNPSTRQYFKPAPQWKSRPGSFTGFGFDANANDYKIVSFNCYRAHGPHLIQIYSLASDSWRDMKDSPLTFSRWKSLIKWEEPSSNGRMCNWLGYDFQGAMCRRDEDNNDAYFLLSFDMVDEVFIETPIPDGVVDYIRCCSLVRQRSHLLYPAIVSYGLNDSNLVTYVNLWVLHEYGAAGYWTKQLSVVLPDHIIVARPRGFWKDNEMLFMNNWEERVLTCYNRITQELKSLDSIHLDPLTQVIGYAESLYPIQTLSQPLVEREDSDHDYDYCLCEVNQPLCANSFIF